MNRYGKDVTSIDLKTTIPIEIPTSFFVLVEIYKAILKYVQKIKEPRSSQKKEQSQMNFATGYQELL